MMAMLFSWLIPAAILLSTPLPSLAEGEPKMTETANPVVTLETSLGTVKIELWKDKAPQTVDNFLRYVREGFYDGTVFHRVIDDFMIQGGGLTPDMKPKKTHQPIKNEASKELKNLRGTIAMARTNLVNSATSQFFINVVDNPFLDHRDKTPPGYGYAVFGQVTEGMEVVDAIRKVETRAVGGHENVPKTPVVIQKVTVDAP
jgi:peptidyl-prolyl cis-trans isomerase B (cyclophilin B)